MGRGRTRDLGGLAFHCGRKQRRAARQAAAGTLSILGGKQFPLRLGFTSGTTPEKPSPRKSSLSTKTLIAPTGLSSAT